MRSSSEYVNSQTMNCHGLTGCSIPCCVDRNGLVTSPHHGARHIRDAVGATTPSRLKERPHLRNTNASG